MWTPLPQVSFHAESAEGTTDQRAEEGTHGPILASRSAPADHPLTSGSGENRDEDGQSEEHKPDDAVEREGGGERPPRLVLVMRGPGGPLRTGRLLVRV